MKYSILIDTYECNGCGSCVEICPEAFRMDENGEKAEVVNPNTDANPCMEEAAAYCPAKCITLTIKQT